MVRSVVISSLIALLLTLAAAPARGQCDPQWLPGRGVCGVYGGASAMTMWDPDGPGPRQPVLVVGGGLTIAGETPVNRIAMWDGSAWQPLGAGFDATVRGLAVYNGELIAAGDFLTSGGITVNRIARWDGAQWQSLGGGFDGYGWALLVHQGDLIVGGAFSTAGGQPANRIARWDGSQWSAIGSGMAGPFPTVFALTELPTGELVAGGRFETADGITCNGIARWDGGAWQPIGGGFSATATLSRVVYSLTTFNNELIAGGAFTTADGQPANRIARWDGAAWRAMGSGMTDGASQVRALTVFGGELVAASSSAVAGGVTTNYIARWDGAAWSALDSGLGSSGLAMTILPSGELAVGGSFTRAGDASANGVAIWDGAAWSAIGPAVGIGGAAFGIQAFRTYGDGLLAGGSFRTVDGIAASCIARWDGSAWSAFGTGAAGPGYISASVLNEYAGELIVGGTFDSFGGRPAANIARWDGAAWKPLGAGLTQPDTSIIRVRALAEFDGELVAGGAFTLADGQPVGSIAAWNGSAWRTLGTGVASGGQLYALAVFQGELYAGGSFTAAGGQPAPNLAKWDGAAWTSVGGGVTGPSFPVVRALTVYRDELVVAGTFTSAGGQPVNHIAAWDGSSWRPLGDGLARALGNPFAEAMTVYNGDLIITGGFDSAGGVPAANIARWDGASWRAFGTGPDGVVYGSGVYNGQLMIGGNFGFAGGQVSAYFARWTDGGGPAFSAQPADQTVEVGQALTLSATPAPGGTDVQFQWRLNGQPIADGPGGASPGGGDVSGASGILPSPTTGDPIELTIDGIRPGDAGAYDILLTNACGEVTSDPAAVTILCRADLNGDGLVDFSDYLEFLNLYDAGDPRVDFNFDGLVDFADYLEFLNLYDAGC